MLEQRLENAFEEAQDKVLETYNRLTVEVRDECTETIYKADSQMRPVCMQHANQTNIYNTAPGGFPTSHTISVARILILVFASTVLATSFLLWPDGLKVTKNKTVIVTLCTWLKGIASE